MLSVHDRKGESTKSNSVECRVFGLNDLDCSDNQSGKHPLCDCPFLEVDATRNFVKTASNEII